MEYDENVGAKVYFIKKFIKDRDYCNKMSIYEFIMLYNLLIDEVDKTQVYTTMDGKEYWMIYKDLQLQLDELYCFVRIDSDNKIAGIFSNLGDMPLTVEMNSDLTLAWLDKIIDDNYREYVHKQME